MKPVRGAVCIVWCIGWMAMGSLLGGCAPSEAPESGAPS